MQMLICLQEPFKKGIAQFNNVLRWGFFGQGVGFFLKSPEVSLLAGEIQSGSQLVIIRNGKEYLAVDSTIIMSFILGWPIASHAAVPIYAQLKVGNMHILSHAL